MLGVYAVAGPADTIYSHTMSHTKLGVSLPEDVFRALEAVSRRTGKPRSSIIAEAVEDHLQKLSKDEITRRMNEVWGSLTEEEIEAELAPLRAAARATHLRLLAEEDEPWQMP